MMGSVHAALLLLLLLSASSHLLPASADSRFGCLFEDDLCKQYEVCLNDGVFGRCRRLPVLDVFKYEVSPPVIQRLRTILQKLSHRGLTWKDDYTQHIIANELSNIRKVYSRQPESLPSDASSNLRVPTINSESNKDYESEANKNFAKSFHQYLQYLGILPKPVAPSFYPRTKSEKPVITNPKGTSSLLFAPAQKFEIPSNVLPKPLVEKPPQESERELEKKTLLAALKTYLAQKAQKAQKAVSQNPDNRNVNGKASFTSLYSNKHRTPQLGKLDGGFPKDDEEDGYRIKSFLPRQRARVLSRPTLGALIYKYTSHQEDPKDPLSAMDETFIQNVVKELGKHKFNFDHLNPKELDELADVIADTLQIVDADQVEPRKIETEGGREAKRVESYESQEHDEDREINQTSQGQEPSKKQSEYEIKDKDINSKKENLPDFTANTMSHELISEPIEKGFKRFGDFHYISDEDDDDDDEKKIGIENVKSETYTRELTAQKKSAEDDTDSKEEIELQRWVQESYAQDDNSFEEEPKKMEQEVAFQVKSSSSDKYGYIVTQKNPLTAEKGLELLSEVAVLLKQQMNVFSDVSVSGSAVIFQVRSNIQNMTTEDVVKAAAANKEKLEKSTKLRILQTGVAERSKLKLLPHRLEEEDSTKFIVLTLISIACIIGVLAGSGVIYCLRHRSHHKLKEKLSALGTDSNTDATSTYQELCRQRMAVKSSDRPEPLHSSRINSISSQFSDGPMASPTARSSTSSWSEEPVQSNMDISTGHMILSYMEDHLKNKNRLEKEWEALCAYQADLTATSIALKEENAAKNRSLSVVTYDHNRIILKGDNSHDHSDYINASPIMDHDPRNPAYIATQGPLPSTVADFWQMVWENGCVVIVMLTSLAENGVKQCYHYWPDEGSNLYNIYEVNLVSEHIWCEDFLVRSFYLKNLQTNETRTVTQFNFLNWNDHGVPTSTRSLLDFRRKVNKCYKGRSCPVIVHCSDGAGRSGTYILIDMVLNKMAKGAKEIDIAATLEHLRDQRPGMVQTKEQFEFALTAVAEEVNAILKALPQ
ncbi:receptor-type tyrosine-protein phosphatase N2 [Bufo gargarizans]|uniref:receptor-type tyrosine-protein phosphatase N2 n=1 Tax=Bufo gargarizans TaxID=30331 RepID=UPI001CF3EA6A|nr:receptor-type tyrosine-protein phosphatase N2 [Bufo gargarizans]